MSLHQHFDREQRTLFVAETRQPKKVPTKLFLAATGVGHGQKGTARALLAEFVRRKDDRAVFLDIDDCLTGSELFHAARRPATTPDSILEKIREHVEIPTNGGVHAMAALDPIAAVLVSKAFPQAPLALVQCGLTPDARWPVEAADLALVPDEVTAEQFLNRHMPPDHIVPVGIPLCPGFSEGSVTNKSDAAEHLGLATDRPVVLLVTSPLAPFDAVRAARILAHPPRLLQVIVDLAGDWETAEAISDDKELSSADVHPFGKTDQAPLWWASADLVLCHPSDHIVSRAVALGKPLVTLPPDRPSAVRVAKAVSDRHMGVAAKNWDDLAASVARGLSLLPKWNRATSAMRSRAAIRKIAAVLQTFTNQGSAAKNP